jgi:hypothetical protein
MSLHWTVLAKAVSTAARSRTDDLTIVLEGLLLMKDS